MHDTLALGPESTPAIEPVDGPVQGLVGLPQVRWHEIWVVEIGQRRLRVYARASSTASASGSSFEESGFSLLKPGGVGNVLWTTPTECMYSLFIRPVTARFQAMCIADVSSAKSARVA